MSTTAVEKLAPSRLSDQKELLRDDLDLVSQPLWVGGVRSNVDIASRITSGSVSRTIEGASTVTLGLLDDDNGTMLAAFAAGPIDINIDGLWFRFTGLQKSVRQLTVTFEDREVALLRKHPAKTAPHNGFLARPALRGGVKGISRVQFAELLVKDVREIPGGLRFVAPGVPGKQLLANVKAAPSAPERSRSRGFGFAPGARITVKNHPASPEQRANLDAVLLAGEHKLVPRKLLVCAVMTVTQESSALPAATNGIHVGMFQQDPRYWPATRDPVTDANAWYDRALKENAANPNLADWQLCEAVQHSGQGSLYAPWRIEAEHTVNSWGVVEDPGSLAAYNSGQTNPSDTSFQYTRGTVRQEQKSGKYSFIREDDWACLQRLAQEVQWRCFAVSGSIYFVNDPYLFASKPAMTISEASDGVDSIDGSYTARTRKAQLTVSCRIGRWQAPPGTVVELVDMGLLDGRWLVTTIDRDLFAPDGTITLAKPQPIIPESQSPEFTAGGATTTSLLAPGVDLGGSGLDTNVRAAIVAAARKMLANRHDYEYAEVRPAPDNLFGGPVPKRVDCSSSFTLIYKAAGAPDPNGLGYPSAIKSGNTRTLAANGVWTQTPQAGDAVFYGADRSFPHHVAVYIGDGQIINMGSRADPKQMAVVDVGLPLLGYASFPLGESPADLHHHRG